MFIKSDRSAEMFYREHLSESEKLQDAVAIGKAHHYAFEDISQDIFSLLFERQPQDEDAPTPQGLRIAKQALDKIKELREYQELHRLTQMDALASGIATVAMDKTFMGFVPKMPDSPESLKEKAEIAKELGYDRQATKLEGDAEKAQATLNKISNRVLDDEACRQKVRAALQGALEETREAMEGMSAFGHGDEDGALKQSGLKEKLELSKRLRNSRKLREIAKLAGRFIAIAKKKQREKMVSNEINSVKMGSFIPRVLPSELAKLSTPALAPLFYKGYVENTLLEYDLHAKKPMGQGPIIYIMDGSGSMGEGCFPELAAKGIGMALFEIAKLQKRDFILAQFGNANQYRELIITADSKVIVEDGNGGKVTKPYNALYIMAELEFFFAGGTEFQRPLSEAIQHISGSKFSRADIIFCTDGCAELTPEFVAEYKKVKEEKKFSCLGILIGPEAKVMQQFCDEVFPIDDLLSDDNKSANLHESMFKI
jgi:uncharacterized protein with von Willebrand factor type A (vWA) domain